MLARDVMLNDVATITADADLGAVARLLAATSAGRWWSSTRSHDRSAW